MKFFRDYFRIDVLIALLVFLLATSASAFIFERISLERRDKTVTLGGLESGERTYQLLSRTGCAGSFNVRLDVSREESALKIAGTLKLTAGQRTFIPSVTGELSFNNLGQLGGSVFRINTEDAEVVLGTTGLRKMRAVLRSTIGSQSNRFDVPFVAGPFILARQSDGRYEITGPMPEGLRTFQPSHAFALLFGSYSLRLEEGEKKCSPESMAPVDLNPVLDRFRSMFHL